MLTLAVLFDNTESVAVGPEITEAVLVMKPLATPGVARKVKVPIPLTGSVMVAVKPVVLVASVIKLPVPEKVLVTGANKEAPCKISVRPALNATLGPKLTTVTV